MNIETIFNAGRVRRWHSDPDLSWSDDYNDGHQGRVARLLLALHPDPSAMLLAAALTHDDGEAVAGDMGAAAKARHPDVRAALQVIEDHTTCTMWSIPETPVNRLSDDDRAWLKFADRLDGYMWMIHMKPELARRSDWKQCAAGLAAFAYNKSIWGQVRNVIKAPRS